MEDIKLGFRAVYIETSEYDVADFPVFEKGSVVVSFFNEVAMISSTVLNYEIIDYLLDSHLIT